MEPEDDLDRSNRREADIPPASSDATGTGPSGPTSAIRLGHIGGDLRLHPWRDAGGGVGARIILEDEAPLDLFAGDHAPDHLHGDVQVLVAASEVAVESVAGNLVADHLAATLTIGKIKGDTRLDAITGSVSVERASGDLIARHIGGDFTAVTARGDVVIDHAGANVRLDSVGGDATIRRAGQVDLRNCGGDLRVQEVTALNVYETVGGDALLTQAGDCDLRDVHGDLTAFTLGGACRVSRVHGDARLRDIAGPAQLSGVHGDLAAQDLAGGITATADGDAFVETALVAGKQYTITANEIILRARGPISAQFVAQTEEGEIRTHLPLTVERHRQHLVGIIGKGEAIVTLTSDKGDILLDAAGATGARGDADEREQRWEGRFGKRGFRLHMGMGPNGPQFDIHGHGPMGFDEHTFWPFGGGFTMSGTEPTGNTGNSPDMQDIEERLRDFGDRASRAARKAADMVRERTRSTDWEEIRRKMMATFERAASEVEAVIREVAAEFNKPGPKKDNVVDGKATPQANGPTAQRIPIDRDDTGGAPPVDRDAERRAILDQLRSGDLTIDEANEKLRQL